MPLLQPPSLETSSEPYRPSADLPQPDNSLLITEDGAPVDNFFTEKQQRLLVEPLYGSWKPADGRPFRAVCNVGLFHAYKEPPYVPDAMLALGVAPTDDIMGADNRSYFMWVVGKPPDIVIEIVSLTPNGETTTKLQHYSDIGVRFYVVFDPLRVLNTERLRVYSWVEGVYESIDPAKINKTGLGLMLWDGEYEGERATWLRWCNSNGDLIPTTKERADKEFLRATQAEQNLQIEKKRADELEAKLKALESKSPPS